LRTVVRLILTPFVLIFSWLMVARIVRHFYKFPMPQFMANVIDNPLRRRLQPPDETAARHGIEPGMSVLDIGPGNGTYTIAAARRVGRAGRVFAVDIEPRMVARVRQRVADAGVGNVEARVADAHDLPFTEDSFDVITMISVLGEIPEPDRALAECQRVLKPGGILAISELLPDPDYKRPATLRREVEAAGFQYREMVGNLFVYAMLFYKPPA
jgi:ubiquinone/menaquinone biosynthesis C-methylase UbiE